MTRSTRAGLGIALAFILFPAVSQAQSLVIFVRHAERADGGAAAAPKSMTGAPADPLLSAAGEQRAAKLATMLVDSRIKAIYATEFKRTQDTGKPLAAKLGLSVETVPASDTAALVARIKADHPKDVVLVIGHSNTLPAAIKAFGGPDITIADDEYSAIYVLSPATGAITLIRF
jgi:broad specificity phosphatase PhoE